MKNILILTLMLAGCDGVRGPADVQVLRESRPLGEAKELAVDLKYDVGKLEISRDSGDDLFAFDLEYDRNGFEPSFKFDEGDHSSLRLNLDSRHGVGSNGARDND